MDFREVRSADAATVLRHSVTKDPRQELHISADPHGQLYDLLKEYKLSAIADSIASVTALRQRDKAEFDKTLRRCGWDHRTRLVPSFLRRLLTFAIADLGIDEDGRDECPPPVLADAESLMFYIDNKDPLVPGYGYEEARRLRQSQTHQQLDQSYWQMDLLLKLDAVRRAAEKGIDIDLAFHDRFRLSYQDLVFYCFACLALAMQYPGKRWDPAELTFNQFLPVSSEQTTAFLKLCSLTYEELRDKAKDKAVRFDGYEQYALSPFVRWPILENPDGTITFPIASDVIDRAITNFHVDVGKTLSGRELSKFREIWGLVFEDHVRQSLRPLGGRLLEGKEIFSTTRKNCDFLWQDEDTDADGYTLIEAKTASWKQRVYQKQTDAELRDAFDEPGGIADGIAQLESSRDAIRLGETKLAKRVPLTGLLVVTEERFDLNTARLRELLAPLVRRRIGRLPKLTYHVVSQIELYHLVTMIAGGGKLGEYLKSKYENREDRFAAIFDTLGKYFDEGGPHPLDREYQQGFDELLRSYGVSEEFGVFDE